jgi:hypothetical protein
MTYDDWKLETPEDEAERFNRRLYARRAHWEPDPDEARNAEIDECLDDIYEKCKADADMGREEEDE